MASQDGQKREETGTMKRKNEKKVKTPEKYTKKCRA